MYGKEPVKGVDSLGKDCLYCETCKRKLKQNNCELHCDTHETHPCYYCHLMLLHIKNGEESPPVKAKPLI